MTFGAAMAIINLLVRPLSSYLLYRIFQDRAGSYGTFGLPSGFDSIFGEFVFSIILWVMITYECFKLQLLVRCQPTASYGLAFGKLFHPCNAIAQVNLPLSMPSFSRWPTEPIWRHWPASTADTLWDWYTECSSSRVTTRKPLHHLNTQMAVGTCTSSQDLHPLSFFSTS